MFDLTRTVAARNRIPVVAAEHVIVRVRQVQLPQAVRVEKAVFRMSETASCHTVSG